MIWAQNSGFKLFPDLVVDPTQYSIFLCHGMREKNMDDLTISQH